MWSDHHFNIPQGRRFICMLSPGFNILGPWLEKRIQFASSDEVSM